MSEAAGREEVDEVFATLERACAFLRGQGYRCGKSKLHDDTKRGLVARTAAGAYTEHALRKYGAAHCNRLTGVDKEESDDYWARRKRKADALEAEHKARERELRVAMLERTLVDPEPIWQAWAASALVLRSQFENWAHEAAERVVTFAEGDDAKTPEVIAMLVEEVEVFFSQYADKRQFTAAVTGADGEEWEAGAGDG